ncbi:hypothetical protein [Nonomuraea dietziae]|uniref:hypothetical protein n=1 Tax=Nonomuraea dietziae TaxID=65515 RepID=UPI003432150D
MCVETKGGTPFTGKRWWRKRVTPTRGAKTREDISPDNEDTDIAERFGTGAWEFTPDVVDVFDDHVRASVPHYDMIQDLVAETTDWLVPAGGLVADLGASARRILQRHPNRGIRFALYDEQPAMLDQAKIELKKLGGEHDVILSATRVQHGPLVHEEADLTLCLFALKYLPQEERVTTPRLARTCSAETGALIVAEKIRPIERACQAGRSQHGAARFAEPDVLALWGDREPERRLMR